MAAAPTSFTLCKWEMVGLVSRRSLLIAVDLARSKVSPAARAGGRQDTGEREREREREREIERCCCILNR
jgi:hypothetical protein